MARISRRAENHVVGSSWAFGFAGDRRIFAKKAPLIFAALCALASICPISAQTPDAYYFFEEEADPAHAHDSGSNGVDLPYAGRPQNSAMSTEEARFGKGAMKAGGGEGGKGGTGFSGVLKPEQRVLFSGEISKMTVAVWVNPAEANSIMLFYRIANSSVNPGYVCFHYVASPPGPGSLRFGITTASGHLKARSSPVSLEPGNWNHVAVTFDAGEVIFYVNGEVVGSAILADIKEIPALEPAEKTGFAGLMGISPGSFADDFGFFGDRALSGAEIQQIHENGLEAFVSGKK